MRRAFAILLTVILVICIAAGALGVYFPRASFPKTSGEIRLPGLDAPVEVYRDAWGVPHIYAETSHDLFFAQGYVHAQDRFWQMDFWRHIGSGRLSEMFGESMLETDTFLRSLGWRRFAEQELEQSTPTDRLILDSYTQGVNAYLADHSGAALSLEYLVLKAVAPDYRVEPWTPVNTLTWAKVMAWDLGGNLDTEIYNAVLSRSLTREQLAGIVPPYPADHPVIVTENMAEVSTLGPGAGSIPKAALPALEALLADLKLVEQVTGPRGSGIGSNSWVISGARTATGMPFLANDPHLGAQMPSIWYEIGLHCRQKGAACPYNVTGFSFAGAPGVIIGHNDRIAWGFTNVGPDVQDLYIERVNPQDPDQYEADGEWVDFEVVRETIHVAGGEPVELDVRISRHGPIITDSYGSLDSLTRTWGVDVPGVYAVALKWTALEPSLILPAVWGFNRASNWDEFRLAASFFTAPSQNLVYADVEGNIGYQMPGKIPVRANGSGRFPVPGWTGEYEWVDYIPFNELPYTFNPQEGYIVTANNPVVGSGYPHLIGTDFDYGFRAERIVEMIESAPGPIDAAYIARMQGDNQNLIARELVPLLLEVDLGDPELEERRALLEGWDYQQSMDSAPGALFQAFWRHLLLQTFGDELGGALVNSNGGDGSADGEAYLPDGDARWFEVVRRIQSDPASPWWDDRSTPETEDRDDMFRLALHAAVTELDELLGADPGEWAWGSLHTITFENQSLGQSGIAPIEALFNRGPFPTAGGSSIVNATGWDIRSGYQVDWLPSMRMIVDLGDLGRSQAVHTTGQSGHAYHRHYADMVDLWRQIEYHPMLWAEEDIRGEELLMLLP